MLILDLNIKKINPTASRPHFEVKAKELKHGNRIVYWVADREFHCGYYHWGTVQGFEPDMLVLYHPFIP